MGTHNTHLNFMKMYRGLLIWCALEFFSYLVPFGAAQEQWWYFPLLELYIKS